MKYTKKIVSAVFAIAFVSVAHAQSPRLAFEVASVFKQLSRGPEHDARRRGTVSCYKHDIASADAIRLLEGRAVSAE
jgi:hypothetical protein